MKSPWQKLPRCCRECHRIRRAKNKYGCGVNLIIPKKRSCGKQKWRKMHIRDRLIQFMLENGVYEKYIEARRKYPSRYKTAPAWFYFSYAFSLDRPFNIVPFWAHISMIWQLVIEREYPEYAQGWHK